MAKKKTKDINLAFLAEGAAGELFDRQMAEVVKNMRDPNTNAKATRKIVLEVTIKPTADRGRADVSTQTKVTLAPPAKVAQQIFLGRRDGVPVAVAFDPGQHGMFDEDKDPSVHPINRESNGADA